MLKRLLSLLLLAGCGPLPPGEPPPAVFEGTLFVMWVGETENWLGDGKFVYVPSKDPLTFTRANPKATVTTIKPAMMYTDGGSIPVMAQVFKGFSPWGYAPAYMVHDWLFVARRCRNHPTASEAEKLAGDMPFPETAAIAQEAIEALIKSKAVAENDVAPGVISSILAGPITQKLWDRPGDCESSRIDPEHLKQIYRALPELADRATLRSLGAGPEAKVIQTISF